MTEDVVDDYNLDRDEVSSPEVASAVAPSPPPTAAVPAAPLDTLASKKVSSWPASRWGIQLHRTALMILFSL